MTATELTDAKTAERANRRAATVTIKGAGTRLSTTQLAGLNNHIARLDAETAAPEKPYQGVQEAIAEMPYGLRTANEAVPVISSPLTKAVTRTVAISPYTITSSGGTPLVYGATGLPSGLVIDTATGIISGTTSVAAGTYNVTITAQNEGGTASATLVITVS